MNYDAQIDAAIARLHEEGRYRTFIDIERKQGQFPKATWVRPDGTERDITVWCGNDYLGMGQHPVVLDAMHEAVDADRRRIGRHPQHLRAPRSITSGWRRRLADLHRKEAALLFTSAYIANDATLSTLPKLFPGLIIYSDALNHASMIEGVRRNGGAKRIFRHNDVTHLRELLAADDPRCAEAHRLRIGLFDGRRFRPDRGDLRPAARIRRADLSRRGPRGRHVRPPRRRRLPKAMG